MPSKGLNPSGICTRSLIIPPGASNLRVWLPPSTARRTTHLKSTALDILVTFTAAQSMKLHSGNFDWLRNPKRRITEGAGFVAVLSPETTPSATAYICRFLANGDLIGKPEEFDSRFHIRFLTELEGYPSAVWKCMMRFSPALCD